MMKNMFSKLLLNILMQLMTETFAKEVIIKLLDWLVNFTNTNKDNELLDILKKNWGL